MKSVWSGVLSFGLVTIPIKLYVATRRQNISFNLLHEQCGSRVKFKRWCPRCESFLQSDEISKGYEYAPRRYVVVEDEEIKTAAGKQTNQIEISDFTDLEEIDPVYFDKTYYAVPDRPGRKAYTLLTDTLHDTNRVGIGKFMLRTKPHLAVIRIKEDTLVVETMYYQNEVVQDADVRDELDHDMADVEIDPKEKEMAAQLVESLSGPYEPERYRNDYRERLLNLIDKKIHGEEIIADVKEEDEEVIDLMDALQRSLEKTDDSNSRQDAYK